MTKYALDKLYQRLLDGIDFRTTTHPIPQSREHCSDCGARLRPLFNSLYCPSNCDRRRYLGRYHCPMCGYFSFTADYAWPDTSKRIQFVCQRSDCWHSQVIEPEVK